MSSATGYHAGPGLSSATHRLRVPAAALLLIGSAITAAFLQQEWEYPVMRALNALALRSVVLDKLMHALTSHDLLQGAPLVALLWFIWFQDESEARRARLLAGAAAAACAGALSRALQLGLPTHLRPLHQPALGFVLPYGVEPDMLNHYNSFPSDHGAVYFTLCATLWRERPGLAAGATAWAVIVSLARVYEGYHFPSDIAGSIGLGLLVLYLFQAPSLRCATGWALPVDQRARPWFYMLAFLASWQLATLFDDMRQLGRGAAAMVLHHDAFGAAGPQ